MGADLRTKNLVGRVARDPWKAILTTRPEKYRIAAVGRTLIETVDRGLFERKIRDALTAGAILEKWAEHNLHFDAQVPAVLSSVYSVCRLFPEAEEAIVSAKSRIISGCPDCKAQFLKRLGTVHFHQKAHSQAIQAYSRSADLFLSIDNPKEAAQSILNRGVSKCILKNYEDGLKDEEYALTLLGSEFSMYTLMASINIAAVLVIQRKIDEALEKVEEVQGMFVGEVDIERPKLILRWIRALLREAQGELKSAGEMIDRIEPQMRKLDMKPELKVLISDRARIAKQRKTIQAIAEKALKMETIPRIMKQIQSVIAEPSMENLTAWRKALTSYVPPFPATV